LAAGSDIPEPFSLDWPGSSGHAAYSQSRLFPKWQGSICVSTNVKNADARIRDILKKTHLFSTWSGSLIDRLMEGAELRRYADGEIAVGYRTPSPYVAIAAGGSFTVRRPQTDGEPMIADYLMPGQATSYLAALDGFHATFDIISRGESEMVFIPRASLAAALAIEPARYEDIVLMLCRRLRREFENSFMRTTNSVRCQLARVILYWARGQVGKGKAARIPIGISQEEIAAMLGKSRPTINKEIGALIADGVLARSYRQIHILDVKALMAIVESENPGTLKISDRIFGKPDGVLMTSD
jgi:CRP-like cAMP-binding protein